jgi:hypothetical protein
MTEGEFLQAFDDLCRRIELAPASRQHLYQRNLHVLVERALGAGVSLPDRVRTLDERLTEAAIEAQFDNMPV